ncbi:EndoU domain-containing protein, partial [Pasteurella multocida]
GNEGVSTMFPRTWTEDRLKVELEYAFKNGGRVEKADNKWKGTTKSGVEVIWHFDKSGNISTVYPVIN